MHDHNTEAIHLAEQILLRTEAIRGAAAGITAASRAGNITPDEIYQLLDVIADDLRRKADQLLAVLAASSGSL